MNLHLIEVTAVHMDHTDSTRKPGMTHWHLTVGTFICDSKSCFESKEVLASWDTLMAEEISYHRVSSQEQEPSGCSREPEAKALEKETSRNTDLPPDPIRIDSVPRFTQ